MKITVRVAVSFVRDNARFAGQQWNNGVSAGIPVRFFTNLDGRKARKGTAVLVSIVIVRNHCGEFGNRFDGYGHFPRPPPRL